MSIDQSGQTEPVTAHSPWHGEHVAFQSIMALYTNAAPGLWQAVVRSDAVEGLQAYLDIPDQYADAGGHSFIHVPSTSFLHTRSDLPVSLRATLADGSRLPHWVDFKRESGVFEVRPPTDFRGVLTIRLVAQDVQGREAVTFFRIEVGERKPTQAAQIAPSGRSAFSEQLREATRQRISARDSLYEAPPIVVPATAPATTQPA